MSQPDDEIIPLAHGEHPPVPDAVKIASTDFAEAHHSTRTKARKQALDVLFQADLRNEAVHRTMARRTEQGEPALRDFTRQILDGYSEHGHEINEHIDRALTGEWTLERMSRVDRNLARIAVWELDFTTIDLKVAISEAMELANELSNDESVTFLNGLLARIAEERPAIPTAPGAGVPDAGPVEPAGDASAEPADNGAVAEQDSENIGQ